jgi:signal transduction histidine kinase
VKTSIGTKYAAYLTLVTLAAVATALAAAGVLAFRRVALLQSELHETLVAVQSAEEEETLRGTATYLSDRLFNPLHRLDVDRLNEEIAQVRVWLPVTSFVIADREGRILTDGTPSIEHYGEPLEGVAAEPPSLTPRLDRTADGTQIRFAIHSGDVVAGFALVELAEGRSRASLRRMERRTGALWKGFRSSLLLLAVLVLAVALLVGWLTSSRLSKTLVQPLEEMSRAARKFAEGDLDHALAPQSHDEIGELAQTLNHMARDLRDHEAERERLIADLEVKNTELERFNYTVSHDLKSPLVTILGFADLGQADLKSGDLERVRDGLLRIERAGNKMHRLLNELLELSRVGRIVNPPEAVSLVELAAEAIELVRASLDEKHVAVKVSRDLPVVRGDRQRLLEVLQNLLENAAKFSGDQPQPRIDIGVETRDGERVFHVRDNGLGIDPRFRSRVFELFEKLDPRAEGTGVGLALVRRIVEAHGGRIWVESEGLGRGATFCFTLAEEGATSRARAEKVVEPAGVDAAALPAGDTGRGRG